MRQLADDELVCVHDASWDRTTNAATLLGPGALVAHTDLATAQRLDAGSGHAEALRRANSSGESVPTLRQALQTMLPTCVPLIEHKAGVAKRYVEELRASGTERQVIVQSFDWPFLTELHRLAPEIAIGALGPNHVFASVSNDALAAMTRFGPMLVHWRANAWTRADVLRAQERGLWTCSYTTDDEIGWLGGQALGLDAMCSNDPDAMSAAITR